MTKVGSSVFLATKCVGFAILVSCLTAPARAANFQFDVLVQAGVNNNTDYEIGVGDSSPTTTSDLATYWANNVSRLVVATYVHATNTLTVQVYNGTTATGAFSQASYNPTGGATASAAATWTLPASSFFATALTGPILGTSVTVANLALSGVSGPINIIQPITQTTLTATRGLFGATSTVSQTQNIVFQGDSTGSWQLQGLVTMTGLNTIFGATGSDLQFGLTALASDVPEPGTLALALIGAVALIGASRRKPATT